MDIVEVKRKRMSVDAVQRVLEDIPLQPFRRTSLILTLSDEENLTHIDVQNFIEMGLQIVRFKMTHVAREDKLRLMALLSKAQEWVCEKYDVGTWPIAISIDLPNAVIRTGYMSEAIGVSTIDLEQDSIVEMTSDVKYWNKCDHGKIFIDDPYTLKALTVGQDVTFCRGGTKLMCIELIDDKTIKCKVIRKGELSSNEFVAFRGIKYLRPPLQKYDLDLIQFGKDYKCDIITIHTVRYPKTVRRVKNCCGPDFHPVILSTICDQQGLDNFDDILKESGGIILAREMLTYILVNRDSLSTIQMILCAKCKKAGKPFFISGGVLDKLLINGTLSQSDLNDASNAVYQGAGFMLRNYSDAANVVEAMKVLDGVCKSIETCTDKPDEYWRLVDEFQTPVNAAEAAVLGAVMMARRSFAMAIINPTVTGRTAIQLSFLTPHAAIFAISRNPATARKLQLYSGIINIVYDKPSKSDWFKEMEARIQFAVAYGMKKELLDVKCPYVVIRRATSISPFCDSVNLWYVTTKETSKYEIICDEEEAT